MIIKSLTLKFSLLFTAIFFFNLLQSQNFKSYLIKWNEPIDYGLEGEKSSKVLNFDLAQYEIAESKLPILIDLIAENKFENISSVRITNEVFEPLSPEELKVIGTEKLNIDIEVDFVNSTYRKKINSYVKLTPLRRSSMGQVEKLISFDIEYSTEPIQRSFGQKSMSFASESKMKDGDWYKIGVTKDAIFKLDYTFLKQLGLDIDNVDPRKIRLFGYGGGMLPEKNDEPRPDDMKENAIIIEGEQDGVFNQDDFIIFYGEDQVDWKFYQNFNMFRHSVNLFSDTTYYFINIAQENGLRVRKESASEIDPSIINNPLTYISNSYDAYDYHEVDNVNIIKSGRLWLGEVFDNQLSYNFSFGFPNVITSETGKVELNTYARSASSSRYTLAINNQSFTSSLAPVNTSLYWAQFASAARDFFNFNPNSTVLNFNLSYNKPLSTSRGWLNLLTVNVRSRLNFQSGNLFFRDIRAVGNDFTEFTIQTNKTIRVWDLTNKYNPLEKYLFVSGNDKKLYTESQELKEFVAFDSFDQLNVHPIGRVQNQNLHGNPQADLIIVTHPKFINQSNRLAQIHRNEGLKVNVVNVHQLYNEYSSGSQDLIAIRSYLKMLYERATSEKDMPKYVVMFGDASYDYKNRLSNNTNFVPSYASRNSLEPIYSYTSDDYFVFLDDNEGEWLAIEPSIETADLAIGRFPVQTSQEADGVIDKIVRYMSPSTMKDWRNRIVFVGDDEDRKVHMEQANRLAIIADEIGSSFNAKKIYLDAYQQVATASGDRYPGANSDIVQSVEQGAVIVNYTGHGGGTGWTAERVLAIGDITAFNNLNNLPVFLTATCEFSRFDDPSRTSAGELALLNPNGGGVALMTTTRLVFSSQNFTLNSFFYQNLFERNSDGTVQRIGDVFRAVKNQYRVLNSRNFSLLGDPALKLALPELGVVTSEINGNPVTVIDTINALSKVSISGYVTNFDGTKMQDFNGYIYPTVFDKPSQKRTLNNDGQGVFVYEEQDSRIFKGKASVINGEFSFEFVVPKDISYSFGKGKIQYYVENGALDGNGNSTDFIIGGTDPNALSDDEGPEIELFMNNRDFVYGGITSNNPTLLVDLFDELGINTVGNGIGHDLVAILDDNTEDALILNDFYESVENDFQKGIVRYSLKGLSEGKHTLTFKAWDVANNSSEKTIEFVVLEEREIQVQNLLNYPNPFTTNTEFIFQHNQAGIPLDVKIEIFTVSGKLVKSLNHVIVNEGFISRDIRWDGRDDFGDKIGKGVYVYKLQVRSRNGSKTEKFEKLVVL